MHRILLIVLAFLHLGVIRMYAGDNETSETTSGTSDTTKKSNVYIGKLPLKKFYITGNYRGIMYYRNCKNLFNGNGPTVNNFDPEKQTITTDNDGETPQLNLYFSGRPTPKTFFQTEMALYSTYNGLEYNENTIEILIGVNFTGQINTNAGDLYFKLGGNQYTKLSKLTLWTTENVGESLFEWNPWIYFQNAAQNYESYYSQGTVIRDFTWGNQIIQGLSGSWDNIPGGFESKIAILKTPSNGGTASYENTISDWSYGGIIKKNFGSNYIGLNTYSLSTKNDSINGEKIGYNIYSFNYKFNFWKNDITASGEVGYGTNRDENDDTGEIEKSEGYAVDFSLLTRKNLIGVPLSFHSYYIDRSFVNMSGGFNTYVVDASAGFNGQGGSYSPGANMSDVDFMNGNRMGLDLRTELNLAGLKINLASGVSREIEAYSTSISYMHRINGVIFSQIYPYQQAFGPDSTLYTSYRSYYENRSINTSDPDYKGNPINFAVTEWNLKYKLDIFKRPLYVFYLGSFNTSQPDFSPIPVMSRKAYIAIQYHEFEAYYKLHPKVALTSYLGLEIIKGNDMTQLSNSLGLPADQIGQGIGFGFDSVLADMVNFDMKIRWFNYKDKNSTDVLYNGFEGSCQFKIWF